MTAAVSNVQAFDAFENQLKTLCLGEFPCGIGTWVSKCRVVMQVFQIPIQVNVENFKPVVLPVCVYSALYLACITRVRDVPTNRHSDKCLKVYTPTKPRKPLFEYDMPPSTVESHLYKHNMMMLGPCCSLDIAISDHASIYVFYVLFREKTT